MVTIITKTATAQTGSMLTSEGGKIIDISEVGCADGTTVVVENLFYNVPARRKFLKKDSTEAMNCAALVEKVALSRPDISIQLLVDGEERFRTPGNKNLLDTIYAVYGKEFSSKLIEADGTANGIHVHGYIGRSDNVRKNRNYQNVFINGRYVKSLTAMAAIEKAYTSYIAHEAFPTCVLFLDMNPSLVDVNVHPAKLEVKFANEQPVFEAVYYTVKRAIEEHEYRPELTLSQKKNGRNAEGAFVPIGADTKGEQISISAPIRVESASRTIPPYVKPADSYDKPVRVASGAGFSEPPKKSEPTLTPKSSIELLERYRKAEPKPDYTPSKPAVESQSVPVEEISAPDYKLVGEAFNCYIIVEYDGALLVIDKHAAHERVIFEDLKKISERDGKVASQALLLPILVIMNPDELEASREYIDSLFAVGFEYEVLDKCVSLSAIPSSISATEAESLFVKMVDELIEGRGNPELTESIRREQALYQIACKAAIKGCRVYDSSVTKWIVERVLSLPDVIVCPHGRPIAYKLTKNELDRQFERIK